MSIARSGTLKRSGGLISAIAKQLRTVNLKPVKKISVQFDPFGENVLNTRKFLFYITAPKIISTNPSCSVKTEVLCDRTDPSVTFNLVDGQKIVFRSGNLTALELLQLLNKHITPLAPKEEEVPVLKTKASKKAAGKKH